jgi:hypothetical protein
MSESLTSPFTHKCAKHPSVAGPFLCARCGNHFCIECCYSLADGTISCHDCYSQPAANPVASAAAAATPVPSVLRVSLAEPLPLARHEDPVLPGQGCIQHPTVRGVFTCQFCGAHSCPVCDFFFPPNMHACPQCASASSGSVSPARKKNMVGALISGGIATALMAVAMAGIAQHANQTAAGIIFLLVLVGGAVGAGLAMAAFKKGRPNSIGIWLALIWNFILILTVVGMVFVGLFMR